ncbi:MAG TPA: stimulus-sensing domain-containing protein [Novosphingobium sp.]|nr:stimulus-sensing domain-containing protein [Novosphingobium sp.]HNN55404.1 stimulus-sensing domain-containing protein [Novosphingobium sp.]
MADPETPTGKARTRLFSWRRPSLTVRILVLNVIALGLMAGSMFYLDSYRNQLLNERFRLARGEAEIAADGLAETPIAGRAALLQRIGTEQKLRLRLYDSRGQLAADSFALGPPSFAFIDPENEPWYQQAARILDRGMNWILGTAPIPSYRDPPREEIAAWPELGAALATGSTVVAQRAAPDETPVINAATPVGVRGEMLLATRNATDITQSVRDARQTLAIVLAVTLMISIQLSLFLARTIVQPLRTLVRAAIRVRSGREREVVVPRLPERGDEIGLLARAISDMTTALRQKIDSVETFAADVAHEIKNPLASLRSALESLGKIEDPQLRSELRAIAAHDVQRIDRLVTEIAEASRIDAELSRTQFVPVDLLGLARALIAARDERGANGDCRVRITAPNAGLLEVPGDAARLERVIENLLDNAISFSPPGGAVTVELARLDERIELCVSDEGPGIPAEAREQVFERFHSLRPPSEEFGSHSGLGLAIARTIAEAHEGTLTARDRSDGKPGACLVLDLPASEVDA